jgi:transcriptional regulator with XRE-family HTH domain
MSRPSAFKHPLAVLRTILGLSQEELGSEIKLSRRTVQAIELGNLRLTEENALKIQEATGVSVHWLLGGDVTAGPYRDDPDRGKWKYTKDVFDQIQASKNSDFEPVYPKETPSDVHIAALSTTGDWFPIFSAANKAGKADLAIYFMHKFLNEMEEKFGRDEEIPNKVWEKARVIEPDGQELVFNSDGTLTYVKGARPFKFRRKTKGGPAKKR